MRPGLLFSLLPLLLGIISADLRAQDEVRAGFRRFTVEQGLSQGTVNALLQDHEGFIWVGTLDGLNRFDGIEFKIFRHESDDTLSLADNWITALHEDADRRLWIGTSNGLNEFDRATETFRRYAVTGPGGTTVKPGPVTAIRSFKAGGESVVLVSGDDQYLVDRAAGRLVPVPESDPDSDPNSASGPATGSPTDAEGVWVWSRDSLYAFSPSPPRLTPVLKNPPSGINAVVPVGPAYPGDLLIATTGGLSVYNPSTGSAWLVSEMPEVQSILPDGDGGFWLGTNSGIWKLSPSLPNLPSLPSRPGLAGPPRTRDTTRDAAPGGRRGWRARSVAPLGLLVLSICRDSTGTVWAGSIDGLYRQLASSVDFTIYRRHLDNPNSLVSDFVMPIMEDRAGRVWFGTIARGVSVMTPGGAAGPVFRNFDPADDRRAGNVRSILQVRDGTTWLGTGAGLFAYDTAMRFTGRYPAIGAGDTAGLWADALYESRGGVLWAGTDPLRLVRIDRAPGRRASITPFPLTGGESKMPPGGVNVIVEAADGMLWVGSAWGLFRFDPRTGEAKRYARDSGGEGPTNNFIWSLHADSADGREILWVGTSQGLNRFDPSTGEWKVYYRQEGFPNDWVYGIVPDDLGRLWLTTNRGITCFDDSKPEGRKFRNFSASDGIAGDECNRRAYAKLRNGEIIFGGTMGVTRFNPLKLSENRHVPPVVLTSVTDAGRRISFDVPVSELRELRVGPGENDLAFEFAALDYTNPMKNQYAFKMEGKNREWTFIGNRRYVSYASLDPGEYIFRVKASNNDGVWNEAGLSLRVVIEPPYWRTWWFGVSAAVALVLAVVGVYRIRERRAAEIFGIRRRIARDLHDEIGSNLTGIAVSGSLLKATGEMTAEQEERVADITSIAVRTSELMRDLIWVVRPENDRLDDLCFRMKDAAAGILGGTNCHFALPPYPSPQVLNLEVKHNLYLIYKEIITNIARHAKAKEVVVILAISGKSLVLTVSDDGVGFDASLETKGMGMKNLAARAAAIAGAIETASSPGQGSRTTVVVPFP